MSYTLLKAGGTTPVTQAMAWLTFTNLHGNSLSWKYTHACSKVIDYFIWSQKFQIEYSYNRIKYFISAWQMAAMHCS